jgi:hypothetical protein
MSFYTRNKNIAKRKKAITKKYSKQPPTLSVAF